MEHDSRSAYRAAIATWLIGEPANVRQQECITLRGWRIGSISGISIEINSSWLVVFAIVVWDLQKNAFTHLGATGETWKPWAAALLTTLLFFGSVLLHELAHSFAARRLGINTSRITLFIFGGVAQVEEEPKKPLHEFLMSIAGPAMSVLLAMVFGGISWVLIRYGQPSFLSLSLNRVAVVNLALAIFNMLPGFPLDGGRVFRSLLWYAWDDLLRATRVASILGQIVGYGLAGLGAYLGIASGSLWISLFYVGMGVLLASVARATYQRERARAQLNSIPLWRLVVPPDLAFNSGTPLSAAAPYFMALHPSGWVPILDSRGLIGVLSGARIKQIPHWQWASVLVDAAMDPLTEDMVVRHTQPAFEALERMSGSGRSSVLVVDDMGRFRGVVTHAGLRGALGMLNG